MYPKKKKDGEIYGKSNRRKNKKIMKNTVWIR